MGPISARALIAPLAMNCVQLAVNDWSRLRDIRLRSLDDSPYAFSGKFESESVLPAPYWQEKLVNECWFVISTGGIDVAVMGVSPADPSSEWMQGCQGFVHSCWIDPAHRGQGLLKLLMQQLEAHCHACKYTKLALGAYTENEGAIGAYAKCGWAAGVTLPSTYSPGRTYLAMYWSPS